MNVTNFKTLKKIRIIKDETNIKNLVLLTISMRQILKKKSPKIKMGFFGCHHDTNEKKFKPST